MNLKFIINKISKRSGDILREFWNLKSEYSCKLAFITMMWWISYYSHWKKVNTYFTKQKQKVVDKIIETEFTDIITKYKNLPESTEMVDQFRIWVFWGQGEEQMPIVVKSCYRQLKKMEGDRAVLITMDNIREFVDFPHEIYQQLETRNLKYAHFSDILRNFLIAKYGGIWYDATCWITSIFPKNFENLSYFSPKNKNDQTTGVVYALGSGYTNSVTFSFVRDILIRMALSNKLWPDYLFQDYVFNYAKTHLKSTKEALKQLSDNNTQRFLLFSWMNKPFNPQKYQDLIKNNWIFKLSYKACYEDYIDGKATFYHQLINPGKQKG